MIESEFNLFFSANELRLIYSIIAMFLVYFIKQLLSKTILSKIKNEDRHDFWERFISSSLFFFLLIIYFQLWVPKIEVLFTILGLTAAAFTIVSKDIILNILGGIIILWRNLFKVGNRIQIDDILGDVVDTGVLYFTIIESSNWDNGEQSTGRIMKVPNSKVINNYIANYNVGLKYVWNELSISLTHESNWEKATEILKEIADKNTRSIDKEEEKDLKKMVREVLSYNKLDPEVYIYVTDMGTHLNLRYLSEPRRRRDIQTKVWKDLLIRINNDSEITFSKNYLN